MGKHFYRYTFFTAVVVVVVVFFCQGCGLVANNSVSSPGYPDYYPSNTHCVYQVPILPYYELNITFSYFHLEESGSW